MIYDALWWQVDFIICLIYADKVNKLRFFELFGLPHIALQRKNFDAIYSDIFLTSDSEYDILAWFHVADSLRNC